MAETVDEIVQFEEPGDELDQLAYEVIGAALAVHKALGPGHAESVYVNALRVELEARRIPFEHEKSYQVYYRGTPVGAGRLDLLVAGKLIVEVKAAEELHSLFTSQVIAYLKANNLRLGLLINFNCVLLKNGVRRIAYSQKT